MVIVTSKIYEDYSLSRSNGLQTPEMLDNVPEFMQITEIYYHK